MELELDLQEYDRIAFSVVAVEVTFSNIYKVAEWCKGVVETQTTRLLGTETELPVIKIKGQGDSRGNDFIATLGCFVVEMKGNYRIYKNASFYKSFQKKKVDIGTKCLEDGSCCKDLVEEYTLTQSEALVSGPEDESDDTENIELKNEHVIADIFRPAS